MTKRGVFGLLALLLAAMSTGSLAQEDAPWLYTYDFSRGAWAIERADGTERHWFGQGLTPPDQTAIQDVHWSPSGRWLGWTSAVASRYDNTIDSAPVPHVASPDGNPVTLMDDYRAGSLVWSPVADWLFVLGAVSDPAPDSTTGSDLVTLRLAIIDPQQDIALWSTEFAQDIWGGPPTNIQWSPDGHYAIANVGRGDFADLELSEGQNTVTYIIVDTTTFTAQTRRVPCCPEATASGWYIDKHNDAESTLRNLITEAAPALTLPQDVHISWNPPGTHALLSRYDGSARWLLDAPGGSVTMLALPEGFKDRWSEWSPDGAWLGLLGRDGNLYLLDTHTGTLELALEHIERFWWDSPTRLVVYEATERPYTWRYYTFDVTTGTRGESIMNSGYRVNFAPDNRDAATIVLDDRLVQRLELIDMATGQRQRIESHQARPIGEPHDYEAVFNWNPGTNWLLIEERPFVSMMGPDPVDYLVVRADGSGWRELNVCRFSGCAGWLPTRN